MASTFLRLSLALVASGCAAQARESTATMSCHRAAGIVASQGAAVLGTGGFTYDRFVSNQSFCATTETTEPAFVPTRDTPQCLVGYRCFEPGRDDFAENF